MPTFNLTIEGKAVTCPFVGTTSNGGLRLAMPAEEVVLSKRMLDVWMMHPELNFHLQTVTMCSGRMMTFLA